MLRAGQATITFLQSFELLSMLFYIVCNYFSKLSEDIQKLENSIGQYINELPNQLLHYLLTKIT